MEEMKKRLLNISFTIAKIYEEMLEEENYETSIKKLEIALECEKKIYAQIPLSEYSSYIQHFNSLDAIYPTDIFRAMLESPWLLPHVRIVSYFSYLQEKSAMFTDNEETCSSLLRQQFMKNRELFHNITYFYKIYLIKKKEFFEELFFSYINIVYSFKYAEEEFLSFNRFDTSLLEKFAYLSNAPFVLNESYCVQIASFYEKLLMSKEILDGEDKQLFFTFISIYLSSLFLAIDSEEIAKTMLEQYKGANYKKDSLLLQNYLDALFEVLQNVIQHRKTLKKHQEESYKYDIIKNEEVRLRELTGFKRS